MSLLDQLWDDTVAGPRPESGLGKLRKYSSFGPRPNSGKGIAGDNTFPISIILGSDQGVSKSYGDEATEQAVRVTRSIMIVKPPGVYNNQNGSPPVSPAGSTPPVSPFSGGRESFRFRRKSPSDAFEKNVEARPRGSPSSPYDV